MSDEKPTTDQGDGGGGGGDETTEVAPETSKAANTTQSSSVLDDLGVDSPAVPTGVQANSKEFKLNLIQYRQIRG